MRPAFCAQCGAAVAAGSRFCDQCGAPQSVAAEPVTPLLPPEPIRSRHRAVYATAAVAALAAAAALAVVALGGADGGDPGGVAGAAKATAAAPGSRTPPGVSDTGVRFPLGTLVWDMTVSGDVVWATTRGTKWGGLTRVAPGKPRFWHLAEANADPFRGGLAPRPGGGAWLMLNNETVALVSPTGALKRFPITGGDLESVGSVAATAPDGDFWIVADDGRMLSVDTHGRMQWRQLDLPPGKDDDSCFFSGMAVESDGAFWLSDYGCGRVIRVLDGTGEEYDISPDDSQSRLSPGDIVWTKDQRLLFVNSTIVGPRLGEITVDHTVTSIIEQDAADDAYPNTISAGTGDDAWVAFLGNCSAAHVVGADVTTITTPFPSQTIHPGGSGELWVAGSTRVERIPPTGAGDPDDCDVTEPELTIAGFEDDSITIAELERDGVVLHVNEPSILYIDLTFTDDGEPGNFGTIDEQRVLTKPGEVRVDVPPDFIRRARDHLANGKKPTLMSLTSARDASGNDGYGEEGPGMSAYVTD